ncbi:MAG: hypothetical protein CMH15_13350 [Mesonia sp.]|nr:hypothetical protein [Mesonia sp.]MAQ42007.1 hypothetical protein [Mesonia sp.]MBJ97638.1 hypothetical protein [Flavobacteriaceae bacterium]|tara:strand:- start:30343 stop:30882 length:540 start_codon:yes stop_codon:yes gene_type:complete
MSIPHKTTSKQPQISRKKISRSLLTGSIVAFFIIISPYVFYSYKSFPDSKVWETFLFTYESNFYQKISVSAWTILGKFVPLYLLSIWFLTCKHWWYHVILIPIGMYLFQLISTINDDVSFTDVVEIWFLIPVMAVIVPLVYLIRAKIFTSMHNPSLEEIEYELQNKKSIFSHFKDIFRS